MRGIVALAMAAALLGGLSCNNQNNDCIDGSSCAPQDFAQGPPDLAAGGMPTQPTCTPPGTVTCPSGSAFQSSPTSSGCFPNGTVPPGAFMPSYDNPTGTCASVGDKVIQCAASPNCSFCIKTAAKTPTGCTAL